jgi:Fe-S-cluster-containing dehydrogenase component
MGRVAQGMKPACVHHCMTKCMSFGPIEEMTELASKKKKSVVWGSTY